MTRLSRIKLANLILFQLGWLACVLGAARGLPWLGPVSVTAVVVLHLAWAQRPRDEARLLAVCALTGIVFDALLLGTGWVDFPNGWWLPGLAPYWMMFMWVLFGTSLNLSLAWLKPRAVIATLFGAIGGPLAYFAGERLGGITLVDAMPALIALAVGWGVVTPLLLRLASRYNGFRPYDMPDYIRRDFTSRGASTHV